MDYNIKEFEKIKFNEFWEIIKNDDILVNCHYENLDISYYSKRNSEVIGISIRENNNKNYFIKINYKTATK